MPHSEDVALLTLPTPFPKQLMYELARTTHMHTHGGEGKGEVWNVFQALRPFL